MEDAFTNPINLIDVNQIDDRELEQQKLLGILIGALKHIRDRDGGRFLLRLLKSQDPLDLLDELALEFVSMALEYTLRTGNIADVEQFLEDGQTLSEPVRGEFMTIAEKIRAIGAKEGREEGLEEGLEKGLVLVAINLLKEGSEPQFISHVTGLELAAILKLKAELEQE